MSEKSFEDVHDRLMQEAFRKLEQDRGILTGSAFKKWRTSPSGFYLMPLFLFLFLGVMLAITRTEATAFLLIPLIFSALLAAMSFSMYQMQIINKRIDKIVQVTGAERKLEDECQATISQIAGLESKKADA